MMEFARDRRHHHLAVGEVMRAGSLAHFAESCERIRAKRPPFRATTGFGQSQNSL